MAEDGSRQISGKGDVRAQTRAVIERLRDAPRGRRLVARARRLGDGLPDVGCRLRRDERGVRHVLAGGPADAHDGRSPGWSFPAPSVEMSMVAVPPAPSAWSCIRTDGSDRRAPTATRSRTGDTLFLSGLVSRNGEDNTVVARRRAGADPGRAGQRAARSCAAAGMTLANVVARASTCRTARRSSR